MTKKRVKNDPAVFSGKEGRKEGRKGERKGGGKEEGMTETRKKEGKE